MDKNTQIQELARLLQTIKHQRVKSIRNMMLVRSLQQVSE